MVIIGFAFVMPLICEHLMSRDKVLFLIFNLYLTLCLVYHKLLEIVGWFKSEYNKMSL